MDNKLREFNHKTEKIYGAYAQDVSAPAYA
jgi:hypothetical protein